MSDESDNYEFSDGDIDEKKHSKLVEDVLNLNKIQNLKKPSRTEPTLQISEFNLVKSVTGNKGSVHLNELTKVLKGRKKEEILKKVQSTNKKSKPLPTPLEKPQAERIRRSINYEKSRLQLDRWEALVTANRSAAQLTFPLDSREKLKFEDKQAEKYPSTWRLKSDLQKELEKIGSKVEEYHINTEEKEEKFPLTIEEVAERRKEAAKLRAHQSFKEAKARRQNKIKSKKYHRILRREKIKKTLKEFEELQKTNPEQALQKLEDIEKARAEERFSLRHKSTGQWARNKQIRAKYDKESRQVLAQQLAISRELTQKVKSVDSESEDEGVFSEENSKPPLVDKSNPWVAGITPGKEVADFVKSYKQYWGEHNKKLENSQEDVDMKNAAAEIKETKNKGGEKILKKVLTPRKDKSTKSKDGIKSKKKTEKNAKKEATGLINSEGTSDWKVSILNKNGKVSDIDDIFDKLEEKLKQKAKQKYVEVKEKKSGKISKSSKSKLSKKTVNKKYKPDLSFPSQSKKPVIDEELNEQPRQDKIEESMNADLNTLKTILGIVEKEETTNAKSKETANIDPSKFVEVKKTKLNTAVPDISATDDNEEDNDQRDIILEAFEDDDIAQDFAKEKAEEIEKDTPKDIDLNLPGWGSWGGGNINTSKRKRRRFIIKMPPKMPRRDDNKGSLIINEKAQSKIKPHMVSEIPFPFKTVKDYEASIRAPIGNTFLPETAFRRLTEPAVITKMGAIIEPITKSTLVGKKRV